MSGNHAREDSTGDHPDGAGARRNPGIRRDRPVEKRYA